MQVDVKLFAQLRALAGTTEVQLKLAENACAQDVPAALAAHLPILAALLPTARVAVDRKFTSPDTPIHPGDEIAIIPPVSGG